MASLTRRRETCADGEDDAARRAIWRDRVAMADAADRPGVFTTLVDYGCTDIGGGKNLHRVVVFRDGALVDAVYAGRRQRREPLVQVVQIKDDPEWHPLLSPDDAFAGYSLRDKGNLLITARKEQ